MARSFFFQRRPGQFRRLQRWSWLAISSCLICTWAWAQSLTVIDLKHRRAEDIIPVLQPLLEQGGALTGQDYTLFVRASPGNVAQLRSAIEQLDKQQRQMLVSVRRGSAQEIEREQASVSGTVRTDRPRADVSVRAGQGTLRTEGSSVSSVQVLDGNAAFISTGTSVPIVTAVAVGGGRRPFVAGTVEHRDLQRGFMVTPRIRGNDVILEISQQDERVAGGNVQTQSLNTQVIGRLGSWMQLGGVSESSSTTSRGVLSRSYGTNNNELSIWVKVDAL
jgi:type II secretory pathway component GspD/PulD (secretin)